MSLSSPTYVITYYVNKFIGTKVGIVGSTMVDGVVYGPAVNLPQSVVEHLVPIPGGEDGLDGKSFVSSCWTLDSRRTIQ